MNTLLKILVLITATLFASASIADLQRGIKNYQAIMNGSKKIEQLNQTELQEVLSVHESMKRRSGSSTGTSRPSYEIEVSHNDELFIINGEKFKARTYCFNMDEGDRVIFIEGSALGACVSATVINLRTKDKCELWCE